MDIFSPPRVLVVNGEPFNDLTATGITMSNLFRGWPKERLLQIYTANVSPNADLSPNNIRLSSRNLKPFSFFCGQYSARLHSAGVATDGPLAKSTNASPSTHRRVLQTVRKSVVPFLDFLPYQLNSDDLKAIRDFKPDVIYSMLGSIRLVRLVDSLARKFEIPVVPHFMDDWISTYSVPGRSVGSPIHVSYLQRAVEKLFDSVPLAMSIGELMSKEYSLKYARDFCDFMNPVEVPATYPRMTKQRPGEPIRFVYVGGLHLGRAECLAEIGALLQVLKDEGCSVAFSIYAPAHDAASATRLEAIGDAVVYRGSIRPEAVGNVLSESDIAVHVESFSSECAEYTRLSVSTKIPQYFAAGIPVLAYGPSGLASCQYVRSSGAGVLVDQRGGSALGDAIRTLVLENDFRREMGMRAWTRAREFHEVVAVRRRFTEALFSASQNSGKRSVA
jgi:glycosyltransferase involved in cell wall biosynthesis